MKTLFANLEERGLIDATAGDKLEERLQTPLKVYVGFDPTADSLHLGNFLSIVVLAWFQRFGHTPVVLLGGATGRIGDPSGKSKERPLLDDKTIESNIASIRKNFEGVLDFSGSLPMPVFVNNNDWLSKFSFIDFLRDVGKSFRIGPMLAKESVKSRVQSEEGMSFTEFSYQLLQSYDFHYLLENEGVVMQMGGSDQWGNITAGIELIRKLTGKSAYGLTLPLLTRSDGKKFGKSEEGAIWLSKEKLSPYQLYQHLVGMPDDDVIPLMKKLTFITMEEVSSLEESMKKEGYVPNTAQKRLAGELTRMLHGEEGLEAALRVTKGAAPGSLSKITAADLKEIASDMPSAELESSEVIGQRFVEVALLAGLLGSKGEGTRLIQNGGAYLNQEKVREISKIIEKSDLIGDEFLVLGAGKKKKILLRITNRLNINC
jgi:tyrosyl-tRNA synthetase